VVISSPVYLVRMGWGKKSGKYYQAWDRFYRHSRSIFRSNAY